MDSIEAIFYAVDEVFKKMEKNTKTKRGRKSKMSHPEVISIVLWGHKKGLTTTKQLYQFSQHYFRDTNFPSYVQFTRSIRKIGSYLDFFIHFLSQINVSKKSKYNISDATSLPVNGYGKYQPPKWAGKVKTGKNMFGFYHGFKLHVIVNAELEIVSVHITEANFHDVRALGEECFMKNISGKLIADKGYISKKRAMELAKNQINIIAKQRENMDPYLNEYYKMELSLRVRIETVFAQIKNRFSAVYRFCRSVESFLVHTKAAICFYMLNKRVI